MSWDPDGYGHMSGWGMGWGGLLMVVVLVLLVAAVVALVVALARTGTDSGPPPEPATGALRTLDERFARGEIEEQEYLHRRALLTR